MLLWRWAEALRWRIRREGGRLSGRKEIKIAPALQRVTRGTFSPKYSSMKISKLYHGICDRRICDRRRADDGEGRCPLFYDINKPHWGSGSNLINRACEWCDQDTAGSPSIGVAGDGAGADKGESGSCVEVERPLCC